MSGRRAHVHGLRDPAAGDAGDPVLLRLLAGRPAISARRRAGRCGAVRGYYRGGRCRRCYQFARPVAVDSCADCGGWGATRTDSWLCAACRGWRRDGAGRRGRLRDLTRRARHLTTQNACAGCAAGRAPRAQATAGHQASGGQPRRPPALPHLSPAAPSAGRRPAPGPAAGRRAPGSTRLPTASSCLFDLPTRSCRRPFAAAAYLTPPTPASPPCWSKPPPTTRPASRGWSKTRINARTTGRACGSWPGCKTRPARSSAPKRGLRPDPDRDRRPARPRSPRRHRAPAAKTGSRPSPAGSPARQAACPNRILTSELRTWFEVMRDGSATPPRRRPRSPGTIRQDLTAALPVAPRLGGSRPPNRCGRSPADDVIAGAGGQRHARAATGQGLRSLLTVLEGTQDHLHQPGRADPHRQARGPATRRP